MKRWMALLLCVAVALAAFAPGAAVVAQSAQRITFAPGSVSATVNGTV